ncbi:MULTISPECIES: NAD(P)/FAD-dependent oxidoreductase [Ruminococcus]|uniref:Thioredoxin-disulfide reductase n=1 Tax=Ruminococcus albus (strain ATCC 27210 / DSM 20455 / JCM 14654 / NCDO 2250 / 7) TaxID=697329 RepID=E6UFW4_RUMA7|nr:MULTISPECIES: FAD-dependent oxidoreductase [Ruminococcus]ADU23638.1 Thioredoxin-disulfide reductase [Ruminococcus albus 7 = DSM 20455]MCR5020578.1 FAD-dependent oxidoreductase [Ruminococcus sp.]
MAHDIIIIGAGPAGMTAAIYARRANKTVMLLEAAAFGGQIINAHKIDNYPAAPNISGFDFAMKLYEQATALGAEFVFEKAVGIEDKGSYKQVNTPSASYQAGAVIIATGSDKRKLGVAREDELIGKGVSYCAVCDGAFFRGKTVAVAGGSRIALEDALYLTDIAEKVYLVHKLGSFRGAEAEFDRLKERSNAEIILNSDITELKGENALESIEVTSRDGSVRDINVSGLFVAVGRVPENQNFASVIDLDEKGYAAAGENCLTRTPGIFVAGDNRVKEVRQLVTAAADGATAATAAIKYLNDKKA